MLIIQMAWGRHLLAQLDVLPDGKHVFGWRLVFKFGFADTKRFVVYMYI